MISKFISLKIIAAFFILSFFTHQLGKVLIIADYYTNTTKYAKNCINKSRLKLHCNGKCQMMKKIQAEEKKEKEDAEKKDENKKDSPIYSEQVIAQVDYLCESNNINKFQPYYSSKPISRSYRIFHPPKA
jgi:hypothetical protein